MTLDFLDLLQTLRQATTAEAIFPGLPTLAASALKGQYRRLVALAHPDHNLDRLAEAEEACKLLHQWYAIAQRQRAHTVNDTGAEIAITTRLHRYVSREAPWVGDLCDLYPAQADQLPVLLKVVRTARNNDLLQTEAQVLRRIDRALGDDKVRAHFPTLLESVQLRDVAGVQRHVNVLARETAYVSLAEVLRVYPAGIDAADAAWIFNRILAALGVTHQLDRVHGAVTPDHLLIRPADHNGMLIDWCYSVPIGEPIKAVNLAYTVDYPPEVPARGAATPATDLYMAARCMLRLLGGDPLTGELPKRVPKPLQFLLRGCLLPAPKRRANDAWALFDDFQAILVELYGAPQFRPFMI